MPRAGALIEVGDKSRVFTALRSAIEFFRKARKHKYIKEYNAVIGNSFAGAAIFNSYRACPFTNRWALACTLSQGTGATGN